MSETNQDMDKTMIGGSDAGERTQMANAPGAEATQYAANVECRVCHTPNPPSETYCIDCGFALSTTPMDAADVVAPQHAGKLIASDGTREFTLSEGENSVGRENCDVLLAHGTVSRQHAKIIIESGEACVEDLGSTNGTTVGGSRIEAHKRTMLEDGAEVVFGSAAFRYEAAEVVQEDAEPAEEEEPPDAEQRADVDDEEASAEPEARDEEQEPASTEEEEVVACVARLVAKNGAQEYGLPQGLSSIGRRDGNDIVVADPYCSGKHAEIKAEDGAITLTDIGSTNGTLVNGARLEANAAREVQSGDEITFGQTTFVLEVA